MLVTSTGTRLASQWPHRIPAEKRMSDDIRLQVRGGMEQEPLVGSARQESAKWGSLWSRFKSKPGTKELLDDIEKKVRNINEYKLSTERQQKRLVGGVDIILIVVHRASGAVSCRNCTCQKASSVVLQEEKSKGRTKSSQI
ncbi:hypothetical protein MRX96_054516 [Rhipicephalus microplus]